MPPTLVSFATAVGSVDRVVSPEFKQPGSRVVVVEPTADMGSIVPDAQGLLEAFDLVEKLIADEQGARRVHPGLRRAGRGALQDVRRQPHRVCGSTPCFAAERAIRPGLRQLRRRARGRAPSCPTPPPTRASYPSDAPAPRLHVRRPAARPSTSPTLQEAWEHAIEGVFPYRGARREGRDRELRREARHTSTPARAVAKPRVVIPVFPGTNCEYDTAHAFERAGAEAHVLVVNNLTPRGGDRERPRPWSTPSATARSSCCPAASRAATSPTAAPSSSRRSSAPRRSPRRCATCCRPATA